MERAILHCDLNNFYASVECVKNPKLRGKAVAVCGNEDDRHGIVLAKSQIAKDKGVKTGDTVSEARKKCRDIIIVRPDFDAYLKYSKAVRSVYERYTDLIEPFGLDECWLDVSGSRISFGDSEHIAEEIRKTVKTETGLTISVGVSFNKVFAKLGSDMKKPDAVTVISPENFREKVWGLSACELLWVGKSTYKTLQKYGINTIGDIAAAHPSFMRKMLGKNGFDLWLYANGRDMSPVSHKDTVITAQSVSRGITCVESLVSNDEVIRVITELCTSVSKSLRKKHLLAAGVQLSLKNDLLVTRRYSVPLSFPMRNARELCSAVCTLLREKHIWDCDIRAVTVRTFNLILDDAVYQLRIDYDIEEHERLDSMENVLSDIRDIYGKNTIFAGSRLMGTKIPANKPEHSVLPPAFSTGC